MRQSLLPEPRSFSGTAIMLAAMTGLPFAIGWTWLFSAMQDLPFGQVLPVGLGAGFFFGVFFGLAMAFFFKGETAVINVTDKKTFISHLNVAMSQLGYNPASHSGDFFTYKPSLQAGLAAGRISVQVDESQAIIVGPSIYVKTLIKRL